MLSETDIQQIVEIDRLNMAAVIHQLGMDFILEKRRDGILSEIAKGVKFITIKRDDKTQAYLSYKVTDDSLRIMSIQIAPDISRSVLRALIKASLHKAAQEKYSGINSKVFSNHKASIAFHYKLGFELKEERQDVCYFIIEKQSLISRLELVLKQH